MLEANKLASEMASRGSKLADAQSAFKALEDSEKSVLAEYTQRAKDAGAKSMSEAETQARQSQEYKDFLEEKAEARHAFLTSQVSYDTYKVYIEMLRSNQSFEKAQMGMI
jgi:hypothetical protein